MITGNWERSYPSARRADATGTLISIHKLFLAVSVFAFKQLMGYGKIIRQLSLSPISKRIEQGDISARVTKAALPSDMASGESLAMVCLA